jgi:hypothetical protein
LAGYVGSAATSHQHQTLRSLFYQPPSDFQAEAAETARYQVSAVTLNRQRLPLFVLGHPMVKSSYVAAVLAKGYLILCILRPNLSEEHRSTISIIGWIQIQTNTAQFRVFQGNRST